MSEPASHPPHDPAAPRRPSAGRIARTKPAQLVLVCRKCAKRVGLSPKQARRLAKAACRAEAAPQRAGGPAARKVKVVETGCLGPCPKRQLTVATGASLAAGRVALLDPRADPTEVLPDFGPNAALTAPREPARRGSSPDRSVLPP